MRQSETLWPGPLEICTDSHYTIKAMTQWVPAWERRAAERGDGVWRTTSGGPPDNEDLMREIVECLKYRARPVKWVSTHALLRRLLRRASRLKTRSHRRSPRGTLHLSLLSRRRTSPATQACLATRPPISWPRWVHAPTDIRGWLRFGKAATDRLRQQLGRSNHVMAMYCIECLWKHSDRLLGETV